MKEIKTIKKDSLETKNMILVLALFHGLVVSANIPCEDVCADVNYDDDVTPADALCIFNKYLGKTSCLDAGQPSCD